MPAHRSQGPSVGPRLSAAPPCAFASPHLFCSPGGGVGEARAQLLHLPPQLVPPLAAAVQQGLQHAPAPRGSALVQRLRGPHSKRCQRRLQRGLQRTHGGHLQLAAAGPLLPQRKTECQDAPSLSASMEHLHLAATPRPKFSHIGALKRAAVQREARMSAMCRLCVLSWEAAQPANEQGARGPFRVVPGDFLALPARHGSCHFRALAALGGPLTLSRGSRGVLRRSRRLYLAAARPSKAASAPQQAGTSAIRIGQAMQWLLTPLGRHPSRERRAWPNPCC
jgi:hypothetical protein